MKLKTVDIFCNVIDNYGDIGVSYRLAREFQYYFKDIKIRLIVNTLKELNEIDKNYVSSEISFMTFNDVANNKYSYTADLIIESFACDIPQNYLDQAYYESKLLINLEYLSFEDWTANFHLMSSLLPKGKLKKIFFMPGISKNSGGLLIDNDFINTIEKVEKNRKYYLDKFNIKNDYDLIGTIFSYEKDFSNLLNYLKILDKKILLFILSEKTQNNFVNYFENNDFYDKIQLVKSKFLNYREYEELISLADFNFVRGEDSFVRALLTGKPFLWHIYKQDDDIHMKKLDAFLEKYTEDDNLKKIFIDYNKENSKEDFDYFFNNLSNIKNFNKAFAEKIIKENNLMKKLKIFIEDFEEVK